jgi:hypothetical protein
MMKILLMFVLGFVTWSLVLARSAAWDSRHVGSLMGVIFVDDLVGIGTAVYLARQGTIPEIVACALGGAFAGLIVLLVVRRKERVR